jgi:uncharacterized protein YjbI with pentapeptide repeats
VPTVLDRVAGDRCGAGSLTPEARFGNLHVVGADLAHADAGQVEVAAARLERVDLVGAQLPGLVVRDVLVERGDLSNLTIYRAHVTRAELHGVRMTGVQIIDSVLSDVLFDEAKLDLAAFRASRLRRVVFRGCNLVKADFANADIGGATFVDCDLAGSQFSQATAAGARFQRCRLDGIGGVPSLRGASMSSDEVFVLAHVFARALGIEIVADPAGPPPE